MDVVLVGGPGDGKTITLKDDIVIRNAASGRLRVPVLVRGGFVPANYERRDDGRYHFVSFGWDEWEVTSDGEVRPDHVAGG